MDQDMRDAAREATASSATPEDTAATLKRIFADQGIELTDDQVQAILQGNRADDLLAANQGDLADANALRDSGVRGKGTWIPGYKGGVYVGRGIGGGLADMLRAGLGEYRGQQARTKRDELIESKGQGVDAGVLAKVLAQIGQQQSAPEATAQAPMAAALRQAPPQAAPDYAYTGGQTFGGAQTTPVASQGGRVRQPVSRPPQMSQGGPARQPVPQTPADAAMMEAFLRNNKPTPPIPTPNGAGGRMADHSLPSAPIPPIPTPNGAGGRIQSRSMPDFNPASYLSSLLKGNPAQTASNFMGGRNPAGAMVVPPEEGMSLEDAAFLEEALRGVRKTPSSWPIPPGEGGW